MLSEAIEQRLLALLRDGLSERKIAQQTGVARDTVRRRKAGYRGHVDGATPADDRCPTCHAKLTRFPCLACALKQNSPET